MDTEYRDYNDVTVFVWGESNRKEKEIHCVGELEKGMKLLLLTCKKIYQRGLIIGKYSGYR
jgi:hypothetical protein